MWRVYAVVLGGVGWNVKFSWVWGGESGEVVALMVVLVWEGIGVGGCGEGWGGWNILVAMWWRLVCLGVDCVDEGS